MRVSTRTLVITVAVTGLIAGATGAVLAGHQFSDVSNSHPFHAEISAIADAGVTTGFNDGTFRPSNDVSRMAMAAFMQRGFTRVGADGAAGDLDPSLGQEGLLAEKTITAGATGGGNGFVLVNAAVTAYTTDVANCPCEIYAYVVRESDQSLVAFPTWTSMPGQATENGDTSTATSTTGVVELPADTSETYQLIVGTNDTDAAVITFEGDITATYVPFGPQGTNAQSAETTTSTSTSSRFEGGQLEPVTPRN